MSQNEMTVESLLRAAAPHAPDALHERVLSLEPTPSRLRLPSRRIVLVALPAALGLAVAAAVVHGLTGSTQRPRPVAQAGAAASSGEVHNAPSFRAAVPTPSAVPGIASPSRLQHTDASLRLRVSSSDALAAATTRATRIASSLGGWAQSVVYRKPQHGGGVSYLELRVPAENVKAAIARLGSLGTVVSQEISTSDLTQRLATQSAQIAELRRRIATLRTALRDPALPEAQRVLLRIRLAESTRALSERLHARKGTIASGTTARISLVIGTGRSSLAPAPHHRRLGRMLHSALGFLALEAMVALFALIVVSPLVVVAALVWLWRRRSVERLLAA